MHMTEKYVYTILSLWPLGFWCMRLLAYGFRLLGGFVALESSQNSYCEGHQIYQGMIHSFSLAAGS